MKRTRTLRRSAVALLVAALLASTGAGTALAAGTSNADDGTVHGESNDVTVNGLDVAIENVHITGEGLPDIHVDDRTYSIDERSITIENASVTMNGADVEMNDLTVTVENSSVRIHDVTIGSE